MLHAATSFSSLPFASLRVRLRVPEPHVSEHDPHSDHGDIVVVVVVVVVVVGVVVAVMVVSAVVVVVVVSSVVVAVSAAVVTVAPNHSSDCTIKLAYTSSLANVPPPIYSVMTSVSNV